MKYRVEFNENMDFDTMYTVLCGIEHQIAEFEGLGLKSYFFRYGNVHVFLKKSKRVLTIELESDKHEHNHSKE